MSKPEKLKILKRARKIIRNGWTQGALARNACGQSVDFDAEDAECFCLSGAIWCASRDLSFSDNSTLKIFDLIEETVGKAAVRFNDARRRKKKEVVELLTKLIKGLK